MNVQFTSPLWLWVLPVGIAWIIWLGAKSDVQISPWRRWSVLVLRLIILFCLVLALAGVQWKLPQEGLNVFFVLDRSQSIPEDQQEVAREYVNTAAKAKTDKDKGGVIVFGTGSSIETMPGPIIDLPKVQAVVATERTDLGGAIRLGTAALPENGQKRIVLLTDGNENLGNALSAVLAAKPLGVTVDVLPMGVAKGGDVSVQKVTLPSQLKKGQTFDVKILAQSDRAQPATIRLFRNEQFLGEQKMELSEGKNLFAFPQKLDEPGFYSYQVQLEAAGDRIPQNNKATSFVNVRGNPRILVVSADPAQDAQLADSLKSSKIDVKLTGLEGFPGNLAEMQSYDSIFLSNIAAGDLTPDLMRLLESAVRDFGVGLVCVGGDQTYAAGGYRGTALETILPVNMELDSKKVLPKGALVLVMHGMEFPGANQTARDIGFAALDALGPQDELGVVLWDGSDKWLTELSAVGDKKEKGRAIMAMNQGDMPSFQNVMDMGHKALKKSTANLKHMIVFSDGDPGAPSDAALDAMVADKLTVSTVMIGGHVAPQTMINIAARGKGRFYDVKSANQLPQIFIKEAAVILKSAIHEEPFRPQVVTSSETIRGINSGEFPPLLGYVATTPKDRAEMVLFSDKGDPVLAHWNYGLGRTVAFTSDAKSRWAKNWLGWDKYRQFWSQIAQWSLRKVETSDMDTEMSVEKGEGVLTVEALDEQGNYRNFLNLEATVLSPTGERQKVRLEQTAPGHYEVRFPTKEVGAYVAQLAQMKDGNMVSGQVVGTAVNYSPEYEVTEPNTRLLQQLAEAGGGKVINPLLQTDNPFVHDRVKTFQPLDLWEWLLKAAILLFPLDVALRRIQLDREEWRKATASLRRMLFFWQAKQARPQEADESLAALLNRRDQVKSTHKPVETTIDPALFKPKEPVRMQSKAKVALAEQPIEEQSDDAAGKDKPKAEDTTTTSRLLDAKKRARRK